MDWDMKVAHSDSSVKACRTSLNLVDIGQRASDDRLTGWIVQQVSDIQLSCFFMAWSQLCEDCQNCCCAVAEVKSLAIRRDGKEEYIVIYGVRIKEFQSGHRVRSILNLQAFHQGSCKHETYEMLLFEWQDTRFWCRKGIPSHDRSHKPHPKVVFQFEQTATPGAVLQTGGFPCCCKQSSGVLQKLRN